MAVETVLRGMILVGVLAIGGITANALLSNDPPPVIAADPAPAGARDSGGEIGSDDGETSLGLALPGEAQGQLEVELPGGFGFKLPADAGTFDDDDFDIDGVGLYPGGSLRDLKVQILKERDASGDRARVSMVFTAPDAPELVTDWYARAFSRAGTRASREGNVLTGVTRDGDRFRLAVQPRGRGSRGTIEVGGAGAG